jgi:hypothetical protein
MRLGVDAEALLRLVRASMRARHRRVAAQRFLRLQACGCAIPEDCRSYCEAVLRTLPAPDYRRMRSAAEAWAELLETAATCHA